MINPDTKAPLDGIRVLDLGRHLAGPTAAMWLADLGADVIKIEKPFRGEPGRSAGPPFVGGESVFFLSANRGKKSLALDLKQTEGQEVFRRLAAGSDVVVENFRPQVMVSLGIGYEVLRDLQPALVYCSISGFGSHGPWASRPAVDQVIQAFSGMMRITGLEDGEPVRAGIPISDLLAGLFAAYGVLAALYSRQQTGLGRRVETSLLESMMAMLSFQGVRYLNGAGDPPAAGNHHPIIAPYGVFRARDGQLVIGAADEKGWKKLCQLVGALELVEDPRFSDNERRFARRFELADLISQRLQEDTVAGWLARLNAAGIPCSPIQTVGEAMQHPQTRELGMAVEVEHPTAGSIRLLRFPVGLSDSLPGGATAPPTLGQHTREILSDAGFSDEKIRKLAEQRIIQIG